MGCGCKKRMKKVEEIAPAVADAIRPAHNAAMKVMDRWEARRVRARLQAQARAQARRVVRHDLQDPN